MILIDRRNGRIIVQRIIDLVDIFEKAFENDAKEINLKEPKSFKNLEVDYCPSSDALQI